MYTLFFIRTRWLFKNIRKAFKGGGGRQFCHVPNKFALLFNIFSKSHPYLTLRPKSLPLKFHLKNAHAQIFISYHNSLFKKRNNQKQSIHLTWCIIIPLYTFLWRAVMTIFTWKEISVITCRGGLASPGLYGKRGEKNNVYVWQLNLWSVETFFMIFSGPILLHFDELFHLHLRCDDFRKDKCFG